jgi:hypothetical protein
MHNPRVAASVEPLSTMMVSKSEKVWAARLANRASRKRPPSWQGTMMLTRGAVTGCLTSPANNVSAIGLSLPRFSHGRKAPRVLGGP